MNNSIYLTTVQPLLRSINSKMKRVSAITSTALPRTWICDHQRVNSYEISYCRPIYRSVSTSEPRSNCTDHYSDHFEVTVGKLFVRSKFVVRSKSGSSEDTWSFRFIETFVDKYNRLAMASIRPRYGHYTAIIRPTIRPLYRLHLLTGHWQ